MPTNVVPFPSRAIDIHQVTANLLSVEAMIERSGLRLEASHGISNEGDPWVCFSEPGSGEMVLRVDLVDGRAVSEGRAFLAPFKLREIATAVEGMLLRLKLTGHAGREMSGYVLAACALLYLMHADSADAGGGDHFPGLTDLIFLPAIGVDLSSGAIEIIHEIREATAALIFGSSLRVEPAKAQSNESSKFDPVMPEHLDTVTSRLETTSALEAQVISLDPAMDTVVASQVIAALPLQLQQSTGSIVQVPQLEANLSVEMTPPLIGTEVSYHYVNGDELTETLIAFINAASSYEAFLPTRSLDAPRDVVTIYGEGMEGFREYILPDDSRMQLIGVDRLPDIDAL